jgi:hypothetical protein
MDRIYQKMDPRLLNSDCLGACIASITGLSIDNIPLFHNYENWFKQFRNWLFQHGFQAVMFSGDKKDKIDKDYHIVGINPYYHPDGAWRCHSMVFKDIWPVHDPAERSRQHFATFYKELICRISIRPLNMGNV